MKKALLIFVIVLILLVAAVAGFFAYKYYWQVPPQSLINDETSSWETYTNSEYGFEIKYPNSLYLKDYDIAPAIVYFQETKYINEEPTHRPSITIEAIATDLTPREWVIGNSKNIIQMQDVKTPLEDAAIGPDNIPALRFYSEAVSSGSYHTLVRLSSNLLLAISLNSSPNGEISGEVYDKMLSTFNLIKKTIVSIPFHNSSKVLQMFNDHELVIYDGQNNSSVFLGKIKEVSYTGNSGAIFIPIAITKDDNNIILDAHMGEPGAGGGSVDYGYAIIPIKPAPNINFLIDNFPSIATRSAYFYDSFGKVVYIDEGANTPHYSMPGPSNSGSIKFRNLITNDPKTILEEEDTSYEIAGLNEKSGTLNFKATKYYFSEKCPREEGAQYCAQTSITERSLQLP